MRYFMDSEFIERGPQYPIELISIGIVSEDGRTFYAISAEFNPEHASQWVKENVLEKLEKDICPLPLAKIAIDIKKFCDPVKYGKPELWGYFCDYDFVIFCQIFGTMMDLPDDFPKYCLDLKQLAFMHNNPRLPKQEGGKHNALADAKWVKYAYEWLQRQIEALR
jgi:3' exoribonuclease, RNase T-like